MVYTDNWSKLGKNNMEFYPTESERMVRGRKRVEEGACEREREKKDRERESVSERRGERVREGEREEREVQMGGDEERKKEIEGK